MFQTRLALGIGVLLIACYPILVKVNEAPSAIAAFYRMGIATVILLPIAWYKKELHFTSNKSTWLAILSGLFIAADIAIWNISIKASSAMQATLLVNLAPIWVGIGSYFFLRLKPTRYFWLGTLIALTGMLIIVDKKILNNFSFDIGFYLAILAGIFYAGYIISSKLALNEMPVISFFALSIFTASVGLGAYNIVQGNSFTGFSSQTWLVLFAQGVLVQLIAWLLINFALKHMRAARVSLVLLSQAFLSGILAHFLLGEKLSWHVILGGVIVLSGIAITFYQKQIFQEE